MVKVIVLGFLLVFMLLIAATLLVGVLLFAALACAVGIPLYLALKPRLDRNGIAGGRRNPIERLQALYVEGKIDLFEFERRVAHLISVDH